MADGVDFSSSFPIEVRSTALNTHPTQSQHGNASESVRADAGKALEKELHCVRAVSQLLFDHRITPADLPQRIAKALKAAMRYPDIVGVRVELLEHRFMPAGFDESDPAMERVIGEPNAPLGRVRVMYQASKVSADNEPFLPGEQAMVEHICQLLQLFAERSVAKAATHEAERLKSLLNASPAIAFVWNLVEGWPVAFVSENVAQLGYSVEEFYSGQVQYSDLVHKDDLQGVSSEVEKYLEEGATDYRQRYRLVTREGEVIWVEDWTHVLRDAQGQAEQAQGLIVDITERVVGAERAKQYLRAVPSMFLALDPDARIVAVNEETCRVLGLEESGLVGANWIEQFIPADIREQIREYHLQAIKHPVDVPRIHDNEILVAGGRRTIQWSSLVERDVAGRVVGVLAFGTDVTSLPDAEQKVADLSRFPLENPSPVLRIERSGNILFANDAAQQLINSMAQLSVGEVQRWQQMIKTASMVTKPQRQMLEVGDKIYAFDLSPVAGRDYINLYAHEVTAAVEQGRRLADIADSLPGVIFQYVQGLDGSRSFAFISRGCEEIWGLKAEQICSNADLVWSQATPEEAARVSQALVESAKSQTQVHLEWQAQTLTGRVKWLRGKGTPHRLASGDTMWNAVVIDVTAERLALDSASAALRKTVHALASTLEVRDPYTAGHQERVTEIAVMIAQQMGLDAHHIDGLQLAASIHDIGKITIPAEILSKPGRLSDVEYELIKCHADVGANLLKGIEFEWPIATIIRQHHERLDGSGYPAGLKGDAIMLEARILAVADTLEAMASHRPYRSGLGWDVAADEIRNGAGKIFDPEVAVACLELYAQGKITLD